LAREHISFLTPGVPRRPGGGARVYFEHANGLVRRGYRVSIVHPMNLPSRGVQRLTSRLKETARNVRANSPRGRISWMNVDPAIDIVLVDSLEAWEPHADLTVSTFWRTAQAAGERPATRLLQLVQAYETWAAEATLVDATWRLPGHLAVVSTSLRARARELGVPDSRVHLVQNGLQHSTFTTTRPVEGRPPVVAFLAAESPVKGLADSVAILRRVHTARPDAELLAFGGGPRPAALPDFVSYERRPLGRDLVRRVYERASVFLCASSSEGWGFPSIEAMACGAALVSTRNGGVDDFAEDGVSALLCGVGDVPALSDAVLRLLGDEALRAEIAVAGRSSAARFTWERSTREFETAVRAALDES